MLSTAAMPLTSLSPIILARATTTALNVTAPEARVNPKGKIVIKWHTTNESQIAGFNIYRRVDKGAWKQINPIFKQAKHPRDAQGEAYYFTYLFPPTDAARSCGLVPAILDTPRVPIDRLFIPEIIPTHLPCAKRRTDFSLFAH